MSELFESNPKPMALDVSLEKGRALHRVCQALNDDPFPHCPICQGTGQADTGASYEWGEFITQPCQCLEEPSSHARGN
jgi:hypothetical protein